MPKCLTCDFAALLRGRPLALALSLCALGLAACGSQAAAPASPSTATASVSTSGPSITVHATHLELHGRIDFEHATATLQSASLPLLDEVAAIMQEHPEMRLRIESHTDAQGMASRNLRLSADRANTVRSYLIFKGIAAERLEAVGRGEQRPLVDNSSQAARAANRRVDFHITHN